MSDEFDRKWLEIVTRLSWIEQIVTREKTCTGEGFPYLCPATIAAVGVADLQNGGVSVFPIRSSRTSPRW